MPSDLYERIDKEESKRIDRAAEIFAKEERISLPEIVENETIVAELESAPRLWTSGFSEANVSFPMNSIMYSKILNAICPHCSCSKNPDLIKPYLERGVVLPVLIGPLKDYPADFASLIIQHPYIGRKTFRFLRFVRRYSSDEKGGLCSKCFSNTCKDILNDLTSLPVGKTTLDLLKTACGNTLSWLYPAQRPETRVLSSIGDCIKQKNLKFLRPLMEKAWALSNLRNSQAFRAVPQVSQSDLLNIDEVLRKNYSFTGSASVQDKELALKALNLDYDPTIPVEEYLDIVLPRKKRINCLIEEVLSSKDGQRDISRIEEEIWKINSELSSSKTIETLTFTTSFVFDNAKVISSILIGALIGYSSGSFAGCGIGGAGGLFAGEIAQRFSGRFGKFKVRKYPKKTAEWLKSKIEGPEERLLATILSKDIRAVQVWSLRRKLK